MKRSPLDAVVRSIGWLAMTSVLAFTGAAANAATITLQSNLIPALEPVANTMDVDVAFSDLTSGTTALHIRS